MNRTYQVIFVLFALFTLIFGAPLLLAPGRFLDLFGWAPVEPLLFRLLGAALLAMSWSAFINFRAPEPDQRSLCMQGFFIFSSLGAIGFLRHLLLKVYYPPMVWVVFFLLLAWAIIWGLLLFMQARKKT